MALTEEMKKVAAAMRQQVEAKKYSLGTLVRAVYLLLLDALERREQQERNPKAGA